PRIATRVSWGGAETTSSFGMEAPRSASPQPDTGHSGAGVPPQAGQPRWIVRALSFRIHSCDAHFSNSSSRGPPAWQAEVGACPERDLQRAQLTKRRMRTFITRPNDKQTNS